MPGLCRHKPAAISYSVSEEELDSKLLGADSPDLAGGSGTKTNRGRPRLSTPIKQARRKTTARDQTWQKQDATESWQGYFSKTELI